MKCWISLLVLGCCEGFLYISESRVVSRQQKIWSSSEDEDEFLAQSLKARVDELGGESGLKRRMLASDVRRVTDSLVEKSTETGKDIRKFLDLEPGKQSREPLDSSPGPDLGWPLTVSILGLIVLLAFFQSFRIDPSNY